MAYKTLQSRLVSANHTYDEWQLITTKPLKGEICIEIDTNKMKVGDGVNYYKDLPYASTTEDTYVSELGNTPSTDQVEITAKRNNGTYATPTTIAGATTTSAGVMTTTHVQDLEDAKSGLANLPYVKDIVVGSTTQSASSSSHQVTIPEATTSNAGLMSSADKDKLDSVEANAEENQNAYSNIVVGATTLSASSKTDTFTLVEGTGISLATTSVDKKIKITNSGVTEVTTSSTNGHISVTTNGSTTSVKVQGLDNAAYMSTASSVTSSGTALPTESAVYDYVTSAIEALPEPMIFKGTVGTGGTTSTLPSASTSNEGWTYKVITNGTYGGTQAKVGDTLISNATEWVLIPSGDEPSGTVTSVGLSNASGESDFTITGSPITSSGTITIEHANSITASSAGPSTDASPGYAGTFVVPQLTYDKHGHLTSAVDRTITMPPSQSIGNGAQVIAVNGSTVGQFTANQSLASTVNLTGLVTNSNKSDYIKDSDQVIAVNGSTVGKFTANQSSASTVDLTGLVTNSNKSDYIKDSDMVISYADGTTAGKFTANQASASTVTIRDMVGATSSANGKDGLVPAPTSSQRNQFLKGDGTWATPTDTNDKVSHVNIPDGSQNIYIDGSTSSTDSVTSAWRDTSVYLSSAVTSYGIQSTANGSGVYSQTQQVGRLLKGAYVPFDNIVYESSDVTLVINGNFS